MKNTLAIIVVLPVVSFVTANSHALDDTNRIDMTQSSCKDALIFVKPTEENYHLGKPMLVSITITNISRGEIRLLRSGPRADHQAAIFFPDGTPVPRLEATGARRSDSTEPAPVSFSVKTVAPGHSQPETLDLRDVVHLEKEGTYYVVVAQRIWSWESGYVVSDKVKIKVVK